jgi:hypothetical protein
MLGFPPSPLCAALKAMNCPGHCLMFGSTAHSYRDLPVRFADFSSLHRNEVTGALTGLTRVRRFVQDDAHIFCRFDQIGAEISGVLQFVRDVYGRAFGMDFRCRLSTRPADRFIGDVADWDRAESILADCLRTFVGPDGSFELNAGDGAFYGPKIDIAVTDALKVYTAPAAHRRHVQYPSDFPPFAAPLPFPSPLPVFPSFRALPDPLPPLSASTSAPPFSWTSNCRVVSGSVTSHRTCPPPAGRTPNRRLIPTPTPVPVPTPPPPRQWRRSPRRGAAFLC